MGIAEQLSPSELRARQLWVSALRSGDYPQTTSVLHSDNGFCCLGVACDIAVKDGLDIAIDIEEDGDIRAYRYDGESEILPEKVRQWLGFDTGNPVLGRCSCTRDSACPDGGTCCLRSAPHFNDQHETPFAQIADMIQKRYISPYIVGDAKDA